MPAIIRSARSRPHGAPAYYLSRPASVWITALRPKPQVGLQRHAGNGTACQPERTTR